MAAFAATTKTTPETFLNDYSDLILTAHDSGEIGHWLIQNATQMREGMFFGKFPWAGLKPFQILALRAVAPTGVFTTSARTGYLQAVEGDVILSELAAAMFQGDYECLKALPEGQREYVPELAQLMKLAYSRNIRTGDARVRSL